MFGKSSLKTNCRGTAAIEFAIVAPVLFLLLTGIIEVGMILFTNIIFEGATNIGSRIGKTGYTAAGMSREDYIRSEIMRLSGGYLNPNDLQVTMLSYDTFGHIGQQEPFTDTNGNGVYDPGEPYTDVNHNGQWDADQGATNAGGSGAVVLYEVNYPWHVFTPMMSVFFHDASGNGIFNIHSVATVRNESFQ